MCSLLAVVANDLVLVTTNFSENKLTNGLKIFLENVKKKKGKKNKMNLFLVPFGQHFFNLVFRHL